MLVGVVAAAAVAAFLRAADLVVPCYVAQGCQIAVRQLIPGFQVAPAWATDSGHRAAAMGSGNSNSFISHHMLVLPFLNCVDLSGA